MTGIAPWVASGRSTWAGAPVAGGRSSWAGAPDTFALHRRDEDAPYPTPLPPLPRAAVAAAEGTPAERDAQVQAGLDSFRLAMTVSYRTHEGAAWPATPFQMSSRYAGQAASIDANRAALARAATRVHLTAGDLSLVQSGRGSPESIHALTQALLDDGLLPPADPSRPDLESRVRQMMFDCGIGIDCAGYVQQAYLHAMRLTASAVGFRARANEDLSDLPARGFNRVDDVTQVRPGDVVVLGPPPGQPGHRVIVYEQHLATSDDLDELRDRGAPERAFANVPPIRVFTVDSSWGSGGDSRYGGVRRESWWFCPATGKWAWLAQGEDKSRPFCLGDTPLAHPFDRPFGIYRGSAR